MAVKIRLKRMGSKNNPFFRMVVADERAPRDGRYIEQIGYYNPLTKDLKVENERAQEWLGHGAQPSDTVRELLKKSGAIGGVVTEVKAAEEAETTEETDEIEETEETGEEDSE